MFFLQRNNDSNWAVSKAKEPQKNHHIDYVYRQCAVSESTPQWVCSDTLWSTEAVHIKGFEEWLCVSPQWDIKIKPFSQNQPDLWWKNGIFLLAEYVSPQTSRCSAGRLLFGDCNQFEDKARKFTPNWDTGNTHTSQSRRSEITANKEGVTVRLSAISVTQVCFLAHMWHISDTCCEHVHVYSLCQDT